MYYLLRQRSKDQLVLRNTSLNRSASWRADHDVIAGPWSCRNHPEAKKALALANKATGRSSDGAEQVPSHPFPPAPKPKIRRRKAHFISAHATNDVNRFI